MSHLVDFEKGTKFSKHALIRFCRLMGPAAVSFSEKMITKISKKNLKKIQKNEIPNCLIFIVIIFMKIDFVRSYSVRHFKNSVFPPHPIQCCYLTLYVFHGENRHFRWNFENDSTFSITYKKCVSHFISNSGYMFFLKTMIK